MYRTDGRTEDQDATLIATSYMQGCIIGLIDAVKTEAISSNAGRVQFDDKIILCCICFMRFVMLIRFSGNKRTVAAIIGQQIVSVCR